MSKKSSLATDGEDDEISHSHQIMKQTNEHRESLLVVGRFLWYQLHTLDSS